MKSLPYNWRISKYDPALRDTQGHYLAEDWSFFAQIGQLFNGRRLTYEEYVSVENTYVRSALRFLTDAGLRSLKISELALPNTVFSADGGLQGIRLRPESLHDKAIVGRDQIEDVIKLNLREATWCELQEVDRFYLHFGWDYYLYVGSTSPSSRAIGDTAEDGLYVEVKASPYL